MPALRSIYLVCLCLFLLGLILNWSGEADYSWLLILSLIGAAGAYTLGPQINWWDWQRNPPDLPLELAPIVERFPVYRAADLAGKREFRRRTFLLREATVFQGLGIDTIPEDVKVMVAASAATVTFFRDEFLIPKYEHVFFYPHRFPTPDHEYLHSSELNQADGAFIWTLNYLVRSVVEPDKYLQLGIYEYTRALFASHPGLRSLAEARALNDEEIERVTGFSPAKLREFIGMPEPDHAAISVVLVHTHWRAFSERYPERARALAEQFTKML